MTLPDEVDVLILGAGPAGLSAAVELRRRGVPRVLVIDREGEPGGIPRHCAHPPYGLREFGRLMTGPTYAARLVATARAAGAAIATRVSATDLRPGGAVAVTSDAGASTITARAVLLATGVRETPRAARLIGGTKPGGVMNTGALQGLVHLNKQRPFQRPVILGTELVAFSAILTCAHLGIRPVAMVEPGPRATARWPSALFPVLRGIPLFYETDVVAVEGHDRVTGVVVEGPRGAQRLDCDGLIVTGQFRPEAALLAASHLTVDPATGGPEVDGWGRLSDPAYFAAGNLLRPVETAGHCWAEGRAVAGAIARALTGDLPPPGPRLRLGGAPLRYVLPQRPDPGGVFDRLQLRLATPAAGRLRLLADGAEIASRALSSRPERRLWLPLPPRARDVEVRFDI